MKSDAPGIVPLAARVSSKQCCTCVHVLSPLKSRCSGAVLPRHCSKNGHAPLKKDISKTTHLAVRKGRPEHTWKGFLVVLECQHDQRRTLTRGSIRRTCTLRCWLLEAVAGASGCDVFADPGDRFVPQNHQEPKGGLRHRLTANRPRPRASVGGCDVLGIVTVTFSVYGTQNKDQKPKCGRHTPTCQQCQES